MALLSILLLPFFGITLVDPVIALENFPIGLNEITLKFTARKFSEVFDRPPWTIRRFSRW
jgi:hypothetical protein